MQGRLSEPVNGEIQAFPWLSWKEEFKWAHEIDFCNMEWTIDFEKIDENPLMQLKGRKEINNLKKKYKLMIPSVTCDCFMQKPFWKITNINLRKKIITFFDQLIEGCREINCGMIVIPLVDNGNLENKIQEDNLINFLQERKSFFLKNNIKIAFEIDYDPQRIGFFIGRLDDDIFGINYDIGNSASLGFNPKEEFSIYGEKIINVHIKDRLLGGTTVPLGEGNADLKLVLSLLEEFNYKGNFIFQTARAEKGNHIKLMQKYYKDLLDTYLIC